MATDQTPEYVDAFERPANPDGRAGGYVQMKNGDGWVVDWVEKTGDRVVFLRGQVKRSRHWDDVEYYDEFLDRQ